MKIDFEKMGGLVPAIIQDATTKNVLMLGFMNEEAYKRLSRQRRLRFGAAAATVFGQRERHLAISLTW